MSKFEMVNDTTYLFRYRCSNCLELEPLFSEAIVYYSEELEWEVCCEKCQDYDYFANILNLNANSAIFYARQIPYPSSVFDMFENIEMESKEVAKELMSKLFQKYAFKVTEFPTL